MSKAAATNDGSYPFTNEDEDLQSNETLDMIHRPYVYDNCDENGDYEDGEPLFRTHRGLFMPEDDPARNLGGFAVNVLVFANDLPGASFQGETLIMCDQSICPSCGGPSASGSSRFRNLPLVHTSHLVTKPDGYLYYDIEIITTPPEGADDFSMTLCEKKLVNFEIPRSGQAPLVKRLLVAVCVWPECSACYNPPGPIPGTTDSYASNGFSASQYNNHTQKFEYRQKWIGYAEKDFTWQTLEWLQESGDYSEWIEAFHLENPDARRPSRPLAARLGIEQFLHRDLAP